MSFTSSMRVRAPAVHGHPMWDFSPCSIARLPVMLEERFEECCVEGATMPDEIAVGVDGTAASRAALEWAVRRAQSDACGLVVIHVAGNTAFSSDDSGLLARTEPEYARSIAPGTKVSFEVHHGEPVRVLAEEARRFTLLVVGTHKTGFLRGRAFGSTSLRLAAAAASPLAVIPTASGGSRDGVVVGIDDELNSVTALRHAAAEAARLTAVLTVIHVHAVDVPSPMGSALGLVRSEFPDVEVRAREVLGTAGEVLINAAATAEVLFIGGPATATGLGAVSFDVLLNISGPTILVPMEHEPASVIVP